MRNNEMDEDYEEEGSEESSEDKEPKLKYQRLGASVLEILKNDVACCMGVHLKFLALGTQSGVVYILDINGNKTQQFTSQESRGRIREISIDHSGEFVGSCSEDGKVMINSLYSNSVVVHNFQRPITSLALEPDYAKNKKERFVCGGKGGKLTLSEKGWFSSNQLVIHEGEGPIHAIAWGTGLIAWSNDIGTKVWDCNARERITFIDRERGSPRPEMYRCCLCWENETTLIIGWADSVKIAKVRDRIEPAEGLPSRLVEITAIIHTDCFICGIAPFKKDLIIMAFTENDEPNTDAHQDARSSKLPELRVVSRDLRDSGKELSVEALSINGFEKYRALEYRLDHMAEESLFYLVSPQDIIIAKPRDLDDHITWLLERQQYEDALYAAQENERELQKHNVQSLGEKYLNFLLEHQEAQRAASLCNIILKKSKELWEKWIYNFSKHKQLQALGPIVPTKDPRLGNMFYEMILTSYLKSDSKEFLQMIQEWQSLYSLENIISATETASNNAPNDDNLIIARGILYTFDKKFDKTLQIYLQLGKGDVFGLIRDHNLIDCIGDKVLELMRFDRLKATELLIANINRVPVSRVFSQLMSAPQLQLFYLHHLFYYSSKKEINQEGKDYHDEQVKLYAIYNREPLYDFLEKSNYWNLEKALEECKSRQLWREMVFIYGRMGNIDEALKLMIEKVGDVKQAIEFVQKQNDEHLWEDLISKSIRNPVFVSGLLENVGTHINPLKLIEKIPKGMEIIGLCYRLVKIINDYQLQTSLSQGCKEVLKADVITLSQRLHKGNKKAVRVEQDSKCALSNVPLVATQKKKSVVVFFCNHVYSEEELLKQTRKSDEMDWSAQDNPKLFCPICKQNSENNRTERKRSGRQK